MQQWEQQQLWELHELQKSGSGTLNDPSARGVESPTPPAPPAEGPVSGSSVSEDRSLRDPAVGSVPEAPSDEVGASPATYRESGACTEDGSARDTETIIRAASGSDGQAFKEFVAATSLQTEWGRWGCYLRTGGECQVGPERLRGRWRWWWLWC